ncbi:GNAT family protein [Micromonospora polyrhachis]|uniref:RimJ/RimL family protein N-acetyltransferase n=1 Tax=Micromonospora polyrhachis TaxID=1282883 RepID=A0A7W7WT21_9ACTN|nr:GNAT family N-acetyltransferase [Micromonospora polyrhachis]MBB4961998.1 RimJ/RimL family protein N-acetyltransferase [Micromonospora polyrhachis]
MGEHRFESEQLVTARFSLRRPTPTDITAIHRIHRDPTACAYNPSDMLVALGDAEDLYRRWNDHWQRYGFGYWVVRAGDDQQPEPILGFCGLNRMRLDNHDVLNLFYRLDPPAWGDGVATEAATMVVDWATTQLPDAPIIARVRSDNIASARVAVRAGLDRAEHLDTPGEDGLDWIFVKNWSDKPR